MFSSEQEIASFHDAWTFTATGLSAANMMQILRVTALVLLAGCARSPQEATQPVVAPVRTGSPLLSQVSADRPEVGWDEKSLVTADFDGDGKSDQAALGFVGDRFVLAIGRNTGPGTYSRQLLSFGINGTEHAATCGPTIVLEVHPVSCAYQTDEVTLPGCVASSAASGLTVGGGECDAIHLYWHHGQNEMVWWRN
jgi:hypothetical protein